MSSERLKSIKERSKARRQLLAQQLGARDDKEIGTLLGGQSGGPRAGSFYSSQKGDADSSAVGTDSTLQGLPSLPAKAPKILVADGKEVKRRDNDSDEEIFEEVYRDSSTFLKGTQSLNPHNDYCQHFVDTKQRPQNFIRDTGLADRFEEYPKLKELIRLKDELISKRATPPMYLCCDLETFDLRELNCKFDVIHIDPPLEEYQRRCPGLTFNWKPWDWDEIMKLEIGEVAAQRSFVFLWCGAAEGLDEGRRCLKAWGFRRCEDICWIKTNKAEPGNTRYMEPRSILQHTKEHCLMGIKGTVRRSTDGDFIHANVDLDIIITEEPEFGSLEKPTEIFHIMEHFCLGRRRLHLFGNDNTLRPGWLTVGPDLSSSNFSSETYNGYFANGPDDHLLGSSAEIETLRPKSPPVKAKNPNNPNRGRGGGRGAPSLGRGGPPVSGANMPSMGRGMHGSFVGPPPRGGGFSVRGGHFQRGGFPPR